MKLSKKLNKKLRKIMKLCLCLINLLLKIITLKFYETFYSWSCVYHTCKCKRKASPSPPFSSAHCPSEITAINFTEIFGFSCPMQTEGWEMDELKLHPAECQPLPPEPRAVDQAQQRFNTEPTATSSSKKPFEYLVWTEYSLSNGTDFGEFYQKTQPFLL